MSLLFLLLVLSSLTQHGRMVRVRIHLEGISWAPSGLGTAVPAQIKNPQSKGGFHCRGGDGKAARSNLIKITPGSSGSADANYCI